MNKLGELTFLGQGLYRPECVLAHSSGRLLVPDWTEQGGIALIAPNGDVSKILARNVPEPLRPNGIALEEPGTVLLAHLGPETGGIFRLHPDGMAEPVLTHINGHPLPPTNFPFIDHEGRLWITISTRKTPRADAYRQDVADGFIILLDQKGARIVADGLGYTNECLVTPDGKTLYVNETFSRRLSAFTIGAGGMLKERRIITNFGPATFPDGLTMDAEGGLWITSIISNRILRIPPSGNSPEILLEDVEAGHLAQVEAAFAARQMGRPHLDQVKSKSLKNISSLAFGGDTLQTLYMGCLLGDAIASCPAPVQGAKPVHWEARLPSA